MELFEKLKLNPFFLNDKQISWVKETLDGMTPEEKIGQLFCLITYSSEEEYLKGLAHKYKAGGVMGRPLPAEEVCAFTSVLQREAKIPMLIAANFEAGGDGLIAEGTNIGPNMQAAATGDPAFAAAQGRVSAVEGLAVGANWAFAPVIDIDMNFRNPITATRTYGSDMAMVRDCGVAYTKAAQEKGMAVSIKHFPGDGVDERDQHLVTSINSLSCEDWDKSFGEVYKAGIEAGALTVMVGHIMQPAYSRKLNPDLKDEDIMPATLAPELLNGLLREKLGFNGMIVTDASSMAGMVIPMDRSKMVPYAIAAGCDMFLFTKNIDEDYEFMRKGVEDGVITQERLDEALIRILATKAALKLPEKKADGTLIPNYENAKKVLGCAEHKKDETACSDNAVTLVKNLEGILPLDSKKYKRVLLHPICNTGPSFFANADVSGLMKEALEKEGFEVDVFESKLDGGFAGLMEGLMGRYQDAVEKYDLIIYAANLSTKSNQTTVRIEWAMPMGMNCPVYINKIPTIFVSFANPYHLLDAPRIKTFINAYSFKPANVDAVMDKLMGRSEFKGKSPVDAFCGMWDTKL